MRLKLKIKSDKLLNMSKLWIRQNNAYIPITYQLEASGETGISTNTFQKDGPAKQKKIRRNGNEQRNIPKSQNLARLGINTTGRQLM